MELTLFDVFETPIEFTLVKRSKELGKPVSGQVGVVGVVGVVVVGVVGVVGVTGVVGVVGCRVSQRCG